MNISAGSRQSRYLFGKQLEMMYDIWMDLKC